MLQYNFCLSQIIAASTDAIAGAAIRTKVNDNTNVTSTIRSKSNVEVRDMNLSNVENTVV